MTKGIRIAAATLLATLFAAAVCAPAIAPHSYERQFRETTDGPPSADFRLGTDSLGRDRFSRLLHGSRITLLLAPAGAILTTFLAALIGGLAGMAGGRLDRVLMACSDLCMCLPWLFLMMALRAALPLDTPSWVSVALTFFLVAALSWPAAARSVRASVRTLMDSDFLLFARASGIGRWRAFRAHLLPNLRPVLTAQFWIAVPSLVLAEATFGMLGLGVAEPMPSWGNLLRELEGHPEAFASPVQHWWLLAPILLIALVIGCFQLILAQKEPASL